MALTTGNKTVGIVVLAVIVVVLAIFLVITLSMGDKTDNLGEHQPQPSPAATSPS